MGNGSPKGGRAIERTLVCRSVSFARITLSSWHSYLSSLGRPLYAELSPVTDFREACCRQNENGECNRGGFCNFMHLRNPSAPLASALRAGQRLERRLNPPGPTEGGGWEPPSTRNGAESGSQQGWNRSERRRSASPSHRSDKDSRYREERYDDRHGSRR